MPDRTQKSSLQFYLPELDALRFFAFFLVFTSHVMPREVNLYDRFGFGATGTILVGITNGGAYGVDLFFALSSYLITSILLKEQQTFGRIDVKAFYLRRILRIWPLYFAIVIGVPPLLDYLNLGESLPTRFLVSFYFFCANWTFSWWGPPPTSIGVLWSVSIEEQFYLTWPILLSHVTTRRLRQACVLLIIAANVTRAILVYNHAEHPAIWCNTLARLDPIAVGALLASYLNGSRPALSPLIRSLMMASGTIGLILAGAFGSYDGPESLLSYPAVSLACLSLLIATIGLKADLQSNWVGRSFVYLGRISYGLYAFHLPVLSILRHFVQSSLVWRLAALPCTIVVAALSYRFFESPFLRLKARFAYISSSARPVSTDAAHSTPGEQSTAQNA